MYLQQCVVARVIADRWLIAASQINLYYPPAPGKVRPKVVTVEVTRKGRLNLHKFDPVLQARLERYLVSNLKYHDGDDMVTISSPSL